MERRPCCSAPLRSLTDGGELSARSYTRLSAQFGRCVDLEVLGPAEAAELGDQVRRHLFDPAVQVADVAVEDAAGSLDAVLGGRQLPLQLEEVPVGPQVGVGLGHGEELLQAVDQEVLDRRLLLGGTGRGDGLAPGPDDRLEGVPLVCGVALHGGDQVGDQVVPAAQLGVHGGPRVVDQLALQGEAVVGQPHPAGHEHGRADQGQHGRAHSRPGPTTSARSGWNSRTTAGTSSRKRVDRPTSDRASLAGSCGAATSTQRPRTSNWN